MIRVFFGGSFDPIHSGHVSIIDLLIGRVLADIVHVVPAWQSPFKKKPCEASAGVRLMLVELALSQRPGIVVESLEVDRRRPSYTVETLSALVARHPNDRWRLIIGADHAGSFADWYQPERLLELAEPVVIARGGVELAAGPLAGRALVIDDFDHPASATAVRLRLAAGHVPGPDLLPPAVAARIRADGLYGVGGGTCTAM